MKKLVLLGCLFLIPLTLVSETQHRFKIFVYIEGNGDNAHITKNLKTNLKRELHLLGDVDIVEWEDGRIVTDWHYGVEICYLQHKNRSEWFSLAHGFYERIPLSYFKANRYPERDRPPVYTRRLGVAYYDKDRFEKYCVWVVGELDKEVLTPIRELLR